MWENEPRRKMSWALVYFALLRQKATVVLCVGCVLLSKASWVMVPIAAQRLLDQVILKHHPDQLKGILIAVCVAACIQGVGQYGMMLGVNRIGLALVTDIRVRLYQHVNGLPLSFHNTNGIGSVASRIVSDPEQVRNLVAGSMFDLLGTLTTAVIAFVFLMILSWRSTLIVTLSVAIMVFAVNRAFTEVHRMSLESNILTSGLYSQAVEALAAIQVLKAFRAEIANAELMRAKIHSVRDKMYETVRVHARASFLAASTAGLLTALVMMLSVASNSHGRLTAGGTVSYGILVSYLVAPFFAIPALYKEVAQALASLDRISELLCQRGEDENPRRRVGISKLVGTIVFQDVCFAYTPESPILKHLSFIAEKGSVTAIVGRSGSGKSTIVSLLCAFYAAQHGKVSVDGVDLSTVRLNEYRSHLGVVFQDTVLLGGSIRENILLARPDATEEEFQKACADAFVDEFVCRLPCGFETIIGETGIQLSGGQGQRLSIARALLAKPKILLMDEATSALDPVTEAMIQHSLARLAGEITIVIVAHRLSTVIRADQILVIEDGRLVESGTHSSLVERRGEYYQLYREQLGGIAAPE